MPGHMKSDEITLGIFFYKIIYGSFHLLFVFSIGYLYHNRTLDSLFKKLTAVAVNSADTACCVVGICGASTRAIKLCPTITALLARIGVAGTEFVLDFGVFNAVPYITKAVFFVAYELVAGIKFAPRSDRNVFGA